ncbi:hypothetical protein RRG08_017123 [Elysia crispata]|uniref:Uncharacterized protein n=1 Tax=Elysia crispata TaxID=231223 RepID=A0AAE0YCS4_9GAST|nr:hypothetical protein RRG08_017123 [Elysia crispata]
MMSTPDASSLGKISFYITFSVPPLFYLKTRLRCHLKASNACVCCCLPHRGQAPHCASAVWGVSRAANSSGGGSIKLQQPALPPGSKENCRRRTTFSGRINQI